MNRRRLTTIGYMALGAGIVTAMVRSNRTNIPKRYARSMKWIKNMM